MENRAPIFVDELHRMIIEDEGTRYRVYRCPAGARTIGNGHNIDAKGLPDFIDHHLARHGRITQDMVDYLRDSDLSDAIASCRRLIPAATWEGLTPRRRMAIINMVFNMGEGCINPKAGKKYFKDMMKALVAGDIEGVCREMKSSVWYRTLGGDPEGTDDGKVERPERVISMFRRG